MNLEGKRISFLGDSITEGSGLDDCANERYDNVIARKYGLACVHNYGIGGSRLAFQYKPSEKCPRHDLNMCARAYDLSWDADIIVVYGGVNDYLHGDAPFGETGDGTNATFCGAVEWLMKFLKSTYHWAQIVFITPAKCVHYTTDCRYVSNYAQKREDARPLRDYCEVIIEAGKRNGVPVLDLYNALPIDMFDDGIRAEYTVDGLHFNAAGHEVLADTVAAFLQKL